jgi:hypothetical protein
VEVFEGNTSDTTTITAQIEKVRHRFGIQQVIWVGDRGMITNTRILADFKLVEGLDWITALRASQIGKLVEQEAVQLSLFDERDLVEFSCSDYPSVCRLAYYVEWHMRKALAPLLFDDEKVTEEPSEKSSVVAPSKRSKKARAKAATKKTSEKLPVHSFRTMIADLATIVKNKFQSKGLETTLTFEKITQPTVLQQKALDLLEVSLICTQ